MALRASGDVRKSHVGALELPSRPEQKKLEISSYAREVPRTAGAR